MNNNNAKTSSKKFNTKYMVELALMVAVTLVMSFTPLGYIRLPGLSATLLTVPVAVSAIILGPAAGAIVGLTFGLTSVYTAFTGGSAFSAMLLSINMFGTVFTCIVPRVLEGYLTGLIFKALHSNKSTVKISYYVASLSCPLLNTLFFMTSLCAFFYNSSYIQGIASGLHVTNPVVFVVVFVGVQGLIEAAVCFVIASVISRALYAALAREKN